MRPSTTKAILTSSFLILLLSISGCALTTPSTEDTTSTTDDTSTSYENDEPSSGIGMTYNGKVGIDMGGGFVVPFDGSAPGMGMGF